ncbi:hypothetical protein R50073_47970 [Maricurvus nonylphenolicus]
MPATGILAAYLNQSSSFNCYITKMEATMRHFALLITTLVLLMGLTACGQKGPLYLPESAPADAQKQQSSEG